MTPTDAQHTPGEATIDPDDPSTVLFGVEGERYADFSPGAYGKVSPVEIANARRLAACWNACQGVPTETLEAGCCKMTFEMPLEMPLGAPADPGSAELTFSVPRSNLVHVDVSDLPKPAPPLEQCYPRHLEAIGTIHLDQCRCAEPRGERGGVCDECLSAILTDEERKQDATT